MKHAVITLALGSLLLAGIGCADETANGSMTEADIPESVLAELDPSLDLIVIDTESDEWRVSEGPPPSVKVSAQAPFNKNQLSRFGNSERHIGESTVTHGTPVAPAAERGMEAKANVPTETAVDPTPPAIATHHVTFGETAEARGPGMGKKSDLPTLNDTGETAEGPRPGMAEKGQLPSENYSDDFTAAGNNLDASGVCECVGNDCVGKWVSNNVGCDVCVVFSCSDGSFPSSCVTCQ